MNVRRVAVMTGLLGLWASTCGAAQTVGQGTIRFSGAIVESGCATNARSGSVMELRGCAQSSRGSRIEVRSVAPVVSVDAPHVRLVAERRGALLRSALCVGRQRRQAHPVRQLHHYHDFAVGRRATIRSNSGARNL